MKTRWLLPLALNLFSIGLWIVLICINEVQANMMAGFCIGLNVSFVIVSFINLVVPERNQTMNQ